MGAATLEEIAENIDDFSEAEEGSKYPPQCLFSTRSFPFTNRTVVLGALGWDGIPRLTSLLRGGRPEAHRAAARAQVGGPGARQKKSRWRPKISIVLFRAPRILGPPPYKFVCPYLALFSKTYIYIYIEREREIIHIYT